MQLKLQSDQIRRPPCRTMGATAVLIAELLF